MAKRKEPERKVCPVCGHAFQGRRGQVYCKASCARRAANDRRQRRAEAGDERLRVEAALARSRQEAAEADQATIAARRRQEETSALLDEARAQRDLLAVAWTRLVDIGALAWDRTRTGLPDAAVFGDAWILAQHLADQTGTEASGPDGDPWAELDQMRRTARARYARIEADAAARGELPPLSALSDLMNVDSIWLRNHPDLRDEYVRRGHEAAKAEEQDPDF